MDSEAQMKSEIERLTATINQHKAHQKNKPVNGGYKSSYAPYPQPSFPGRHNPYVNPNYKPANKYIRPGLSVAGPSKPASTTIINTAMITTPTPTVPPSSSTPLSSTGGQTKEVVLGGVAFESSSRSLVRKDLPKSSKPVSTGKPTPPSTRSQHLRHFVRKTGHVPPGRAYKQKSRRGRNMTLNNTRRPYSSSRKSTKRINKYVDKPCPRFTTTGSCSRGLTCMYQHDPAKIAICWSFLQGNCPKTAETCNLSHEPTPERTPLCLHFLNKGRCTRQNCPYPHVNVGPRQGVCRDFAVLGYCERGLDCERQHVRECPDFAEKGTCGTKGCKLPHVIRANRNRKVAAPVSQDKVAPMEEVTATAEDGQLGDEYISLTFKESDSSESEGSEDDEESDEEEEEEDYEMEVTM
ncbi:hypothetical protein M413DRAFT_442621 [Hebeloma cylindrosporum]|uniref:C3H1-type domain-containing protein n=1 Tax=Hebeloma cylindrosporum TaxID=76867 RepID=A0A0C3C741_HEBCY|nr:hypothetical protein M413DRAFT_442621 [Hebeloma cylindrosporum h7]